ncbi:MAG: NFACT family protein [Methanosphaera sp.]|nr:NFACT family protein [Methanosphaera sp.]
MSNVDIHTITKQLNEELVNARIDKAYQPSEDTIRIKLRKPGEGRKDLVIQAGVRIHLTNYPQPNPTIPPNFPMLLRKHLSGGIITSINQYEFDRIVEITVQKSDNYKIIVELLDKGNVILLDSENNIISPLKHKHLQQRNITAHKEYVYPEQKEIKLNNSTVEELERVISNSSTDITRTLATNGLGGLYAEEIISYTDIDKSTQCSNITQEQIIQLNDALKLLFRKLEDNVDCQIIVEEKNGKMVNKDFIPISLNKYKDYESKHYDDFNKTVDEFYSTKIVNNVHDQQEKKWQKRIGKYEKRLKMQEDTLKGFYKTIDDTQHKGDTIYAHYNEIQQVIDVLHDAREKYSWKEIKSIIKKSKKEGNIPELAMIDNVDNMGVLTLKIDDVTVQIDTNTGIPESTEKYYNKGKKAKRKITGVKEAMENTKREIKKLEDKKLDEMTILEEKQQRREKRELKWYEKLRWFVSRDGYLVIGGRDANSNDMVVKKYSSNNDMYLHCDIHGAPSTIIQNPNGNMEDIPESTIYDAACFASSYSSAWSEGFSTYDAYWVSLDQVSKTPNPGEYLNRGAFVIRGHKNYVRNVPVLIAIGVVEYDNDKRIMAGPVESVSNMSNNFVIVKPGFTKKEKISKQILKIIDEDNLFNVDDIVRSLPSGKCDILDIREYNQKYGKKK